MPRNTRSTRSAILSQRPRGSRPDLPGQLSHHLRNNGWAKPGQRIGVAVSGGADSVALFLLLLELREKLGIVLSVAHFNHQLRGRSSENDEKFVARLAASHGVPCFLAHQDIAFKSRRERSNLEDAARRARYAFFERLVSQGKLDRIAVAHTSDDQAETVLAHLLRGSGLAGLAGIHPEFGSVFRPLLNFRRADLRAYLRARRQPWREDLTNRDTKRTRARIRLKLVPFLQKHFQPLVVEHLCQLAEFARIDETWLTSCATERLNSLAAEIEGEVRIPVAHFRPTLDLQPKDREIPNNLTFARALAGRMVRLLVARVKPGSGQLSAVHVDAVLRLAQQPDSGNLVQLPGAVEVRRLRDCLCFRPSSAGSGRSRTLPSSFSHTIQLGPSPVDVLLREQSCCLRFRVIDWSAQGRDTSIRGALLDRDRVGLPLVVRNWRPGDSMRPIGHQKPHKLSRMLNELGVSRWQKASWPVLDSAGKIAWTRGLPVCAEFAVGSSTRQALVISEVPYS